MTNPEPDAPLSRWAITGVTFAVTMLIVVGSFQIFGGLAAIIEDDYFVVSDDYVYHWDATGWGWVHIILGTLLIIVGLGLGLGQAWAIVMAIAVCVLSAIANFFYIPYYPFWAIVIIALNAWIIWSLTRPGLVRTE